MTDGSDRTTGLARLRARLTYANVMATLALFIALGGVGYAANSLSEENFDEGFPLWDGRTYSVKTTQTRTPPVGNSFYIAVFCDPGDRQIGGGFRDFLPEDGVVTDNSPRKKFGPETSPNPQGWQVSFTNTKPNTQIGSEGVTVVVRCADFGEPH